MSHSQRNQGALIEGRIQRNQLKVWKRQSPKLQQILGQTRGILGLVGLGALPLESHTLADLDLTLRQQIANLGATYLVPRPAASKVLALAQQEWPDSYVGDPLPPTEMFGVMVTLVPLYIVERERP
jgi:hypothetical protein